LNALPEFWAAILGWLDLIAGRKEAASKFNLSRAGLINATGCYFAIVMLSIVVATLMGLNPGLWSTIASLVASAVPLLVVWLVSWSTSIAARPAQGMLALLVPATYAMALLLIVRLPLEYAAPGIFTNALLGALGFMLYRGARGVAGIGVANALVHAVLCILALVGVAIGLYMLASGGVGTG
jgi:hypothetical protein